MNWNQVGTIGLSVGLCACFALQCCTRMRAVCRQNKKYIGQLIAVCEWADDLPCCECDTAWTSRNLVDPHCTACEIDADRLMVILHGKEGE